MIPCGMENSIYNKNFLIMRCKMRDKEGYVNFSDLFRVGIVKILFFVYYVWCTSCNQLWTDIAAMCHCDLDFFAIIFGQFCNIFLHFSFHFPPPNLMFFFPKRVYFRNTPLPSEAAHIWKQTKRVTVKLFLVVLNVKP